MNTRCLGTEAERSLRMLSLRRSYCRCRMAVCCCLAWRPPAARTPLTLPRLPCCFSEPTASVPPQSDVYRMLHDNREEPSQPRQSGSFRVLQELVNDGESPGRLVPVMGRAWWQARGRGDGKQTGNGRLNMHCIWKSNESPPRGFGWCLG